MHGKKDLLSFSSSGESFTVLSLANSELTPKMVEMGLYAGKKIRVLFRAPFGGPIAIDVDGYVLSLRLEEARMVAVKPLVL